MHMYTSLRLQAGWGHDAEYTGVGEGSERPKHMTRTFTSWISFSSDPAAVVKRFMKCFGVTTARRKPRVFKIKLSMCKICRGGQGTGQAANTSW